MNSAFQEVQDSSGFRWEGFPARTNVFFGGLPSDFTKRDLENLAGRYGIVKNSKLMIDLNTGKSKCYGFVNFLYHQDAEYAVASLDNGILYNKRIHVKFAESEEKYGTPSKVVFVKSLPLHFNDDDVIRAFSFVGKILAVKMLRDYSKQRPIRGYYIKFATVSDALSCIHNMDNVKVVEDGWPLFIRFSSDNVDFGETEDRIAEGRKLICVERRIRGTWNYSQYYL